MNIEVSRPTRHVPTSRSNETPPPSREMVAFSLLVRRCASSTRRDRGCGRQSLLYRSACWGADTHRHITVQTARPCFERNFVANSSGFPVNSRFSRGHPRARNPANQMSASSAAVWGIDLALAAVYIERQVFRIIQVVHGPFQEELGLPAARSSCFTYSSPNSPSASASSATEPSRKSTGERRHFSSLKSRLCASRESRTGAVRRLAKSSPQQVHLSRESIEAYV